MTFLMGAPVKALPRQNPNPLRAALSSMSFFKRSFSARPDQGESGRRAEGKSTCCWANVVHLYPAVITLFPPISRTQRASRLRSQENFWPLLRKSFELGAELLAGEILPRRQDRKARDHHRH